MKRLVFLVEGEGDFAAVPSLAGRWLSDNPEWYQFVHFDTKPFQIGGIHKVSGKLKTQAERQRYLKLASKRPDVGAIFAILDGDLSKFEGRPFCVVEAARTLAERARDVGAGVLFSFGIAIISKEYESILLAAAAQLPGMVVGISIPQSPESIRGAKEWLNDNLVEGYRSASQQNQLTKSIKDWAPIRETHRSFRRFENVLLQLVTAMSSEAHVVTPAPQVANTNATN